MTNTTSPQNYTADKNYDSEFCGSIPLHLVNLIQPHGILLMLDKEELRIRQVSENVAQSLHIQPDDILHTLLADYLPAAQFEDLRNKLSNHLSQDKIPFTLHVNTQQQQVTFTALIHPEEDYVLVELEEAKPYEAYSFIEFFQQVKYITSRLKQAASTAEIAQMAADELKRFTGFDRVLVYKFDEQWNGTVIGQAREADMSDYMGLRFPASDVPRQARELYFKNPYRLIPTRQYQPARLVPVINPLTQRFTDLSDCNLRSVAGVHLEYLTNLNIMASMSLPIIIENKLWGLISCHHKQAKNPAYEERTAMELLTAIISTQLSSKERESNITLQAQLRGVHARLLEQVYNSTSFADGLLEGETHILELLSLTGAAVVYEGDVRTTGQTPEPQKLKELVSWLRRNSTERTFATNTLPRLYPNSQDYHQVASGLIALPINREQGEYILGFREEVLQTVNWGGNPDQAIQMEPDGKHYHPRNSFATYQETVKHTSIPWQDEEVAAAEALRSAVLEKIIREKY
ncbi:GAF domain-containing protein [Pontibacter roseus]|uniref:GAF domain-containing protein n=1 Tax=Pontibacter roseus TaxID=336989 RepID=UPI0012F9CAEE|nr:GAF domain-containing protein [Pontibacter roseus]